MHILLLGAGGREHALAWKIRQSTFCSQLFIAPGNAGTQHLGTNIALDVLDFSAIAVFVAKEKIELIIVGPEEPLVKGIYDYFLQKGVAVIGPSQAAAQLEGSKSFSKSFMQRNNIPTAAYAAFTAANYEDGVAYISKHTLPIVLKADGLAAGKGVVICNHTSEALEVFAQMILGKQFGEASSRVVVEQFLEGIEVSVFAVTDGLSYKIIGHAKDYKRIGDGDEGPNTGGMGCVSPVPFVTSDFMAKVMDQIVTPTINGLQLEQLVYKGFLFFGLMNVAGNPYVIEYNCRLGDPETEVILPRIENDLVELLLQVSNGQLAEVEVSLNNKAVACVVVVSGGYPGKYEKEIPIQMPDTNTLPANVLIFHAGTQQAANGEILTNGGRVITITASGDNIQDAAKTATAIAEEVKFRGSYYRKDIGYEFI